MPAARSDELFGHPRGLYVCFFTEMWERFSFYGMKALLFLYITKHHLFGDDPAYDLIGAYGGLVYAVPVIGGLIADRLLGMRKAVLLGGILLCLGHFGMAVEGEQARLVGGEVVRDAGALQVFYFSLALIVVGVGFLKPNISTIVGRLYADDDPRRDSGFTIFYAGINVGALLSSLLCAWLGETYGWRYGFGAAGVGMLAGLAQFLVGQKHLHGHAEPPDASALRRRVLGAIDVERAVWLGALAGVALCWQLIQRAWTVQGAMHVVSAIFCAWFAWFLATRCNRVQRAQMLSLAVLIFWCLVFFTMYEQTYGSWIAFNDRLMGKSLLGVDLSAGALTFLGSFWLVLLSPPAAWLWPWLERRGWNPGKPVKSALGLAIGGLAFLPLVAATGEVGASTIASVWWIVLAYLVLEVAEVCISPIGLSAVTQLSVPRVTALMMGAWFLATAYSEVLAAAFGKLSSLDVPAGTVMDPIAAAARYRHLFWVMTWIGLGSGAIALVLAPLIRRGMHGVK